MFTVLVTLNILPRDPPVVLWQNTLDVKLTGRAQFKVRSKDFTLKRSHVVLFNITVALQGAFFKI